MYDQLDPDRSDLDAYLAIAEELGARSVLDVGCGTGTFALLLAERGLDVVGLDPAAASLGVARAKAGAEKVRWIHGDATALPALSVDLATMTGNVAQAIVHGADWDATLRRIHDAVRPGGHLVFETRDPAPEGWREWHDTSRAHRDRGRGCRRALGRTHGREPASGDVPLDVRLPRRRGPDFGLDAALSRARRGRVLARRPRVRGRGRPRRSR